MSSGDVPKCDKCGFYLYPDHICRPGLAKACGEKIIKPMTNHKSKAQEIIEYVQNCINEGNSTMAHQYVDGKLREAEISGARKMREKCLEEAKKLIEGLAYARIAISSESLCELLVNISPESVVEG